MQFLIRVLNGVIREKKIEYRKIVSIIVRVGFAISGGIKDWRRLLQTEATV